MTRAQLLAAILGILSLTAFWQGLTPLQKVLLENRIETRIEQIPEDRLLRVSPDKIDGVVRQNGEVKYRWKERLAQADAQILEQISGKKIRRLLEQTQYSRIWESEEPNIFVGEFYAGLPAFTEENGVWYDTAYATTSEEDFDLQTKPETAFLVKRAYAQTTFDSTTDDGELYSYNAAWASAVAGSNLTLSLTPIGAYVENNYNGSNYILRKFLFPFDTSALPDTATISSAVFGFYVVGVNNGDNDGNDWFTVFDYSGAIPITTGDWNNWGSTKWSADKDITGLGTGAYTDWTLNATGIAGVSKTGTTKIGIRGGHEYNNQTITGDNYILGYMSENGSNKPRLVVTYSSYTSKGYVEMYNATLEPGVIIGTP